MARYYYVKNLENELKKGAHHIDEIKEEITPDELWEDQYEHKYGKEWKVKSKNRRRFHGNIICSSCLSKWKDGGFKDLTHWLGFRKLPGSESKLSRTYVHNPYKLDKIDGKCTPGQLNRNANLMIEFNKQSRVFQWVLSFNGGNIEEIQNKIENKFEVSEFNIDHNEVILANRPNNNLSIEKTNKNIKQIYRFECPDFSKPVFFESTSKSNGRFYEIKNPQNRIKNLPFDSNGLLIWWPEKFDDWSSEINYSEHKMWGPKIKNFIQGINGTWLRIRLNREINRVESRELAKYFDGIEEFKLEYKNMGIRLMLKNKGIKEYFDGETIYLNDEIIDGMLVLQGNTSVHQGNFILSYEEKNSSRTDAEIIDFNKEKSSCIGFNINSNYKPKNILNSEAELRIRLENNDDKYVEYRYSLIFGDKLTTSVERKDIRNNFVKLNENLDSDLSVEILKEILPERLDIKYEILEKLKIITNENPRSISWDFIRRIGQNKKFQNEDGFQIENKSVVSRNMNLVWELLQAILDENERIEPISKIGNKYITNNERRERLGVIYSKPEDNDKEDRYHIPIFDHAIKLFNSNWYLLFTSKPLFESTFGNSVANHYFGTEIISEFIDRIHISPYGAILINLEKNKFPKDTIFDLPSVSHIAKSPSSFLNMMFLKVKDNLADYLENPLTKDTQVFVWSGAKSSSNHILPHIPYSWNQLFDYRSNYGFTDLDHEKDPVILEFSDFSCSLYLIKKLSDELFSVYLKIDYNSKSYYVKLLDTDYGYDSNIKATSNSKLISSEPKSKSFLKFDSYYFLRETFRAFWCLTYESKILKKKLLKGGSRPKRQNLWNLGLSKDPEMLYFLLEKMTIIWDIHY